MQVAEQRPRKPEASSGPPLGVRLGNQDLCALGFQVPLRFALFSSFGLGLLVRSTSHVLIA